jgi:ubiquinone/menaquinone biosynthesis C-methylase UbiE
MKNPEKNKIVLSEKEFQHWVSHINNYRLPLMNYLDGRMNFCGIGVELGAGTCWLSSILSTKKGVNKMFAIDANADRLDLAKEKFIGYFGGKLEKIEIIRGDYHSLPFEKASLDFIVADASLHHSDDIHRLLEECKRILKPSGFLVAIREPILPRVEPLKTYRKLTFGLKEKRKGEIENIYSWEQWKNNFEKSGFSLDIFECFLDTTAKERLIKKSRIFNGLLFCRYFFVAKALDDGK